MTQIMFETFCVPKMHILPTPTLSCYASGRTTAYMLDIGDTVMHGIPMIDGSMVPHLAFRLDIGGRNLTDYAMKLSSKSSGPPLTFSSARWLKENHCQVALDFEKETAGLSPKTIVLPTGESVNVTSELLAIPEPLFNPGLLGFESDGIAGLVFKSIKKDGDTRLRSSWCESIALSGGSSLFPNLDKRLRDELQKVVDYKVQVFPTIDRYSAWNGAAMLTSLDTFESRWITLPEYDEHGPSLVHRKCW